MKDFQRRPIIGVMAIFLLVALLPSCEGRGEKTANNEDADGYIRFTVQWPSPYVAKALSEVRGPSFAPSGDVCQDYLVQNINVGVYTTSNSLVTSRTFSCSAHTGFVAVSPGNYNILVDGLDGTGVDNWRGQKTGLAVSQGMTTDAGGVAMSYIGTDVTPPTVVSTLPADGATGVATNAAVTAVFSEDVAAWSIDTSSFIITRGSVTILGVVSYAAASKTASFLPTTLLSDRSVFTATITTGARDLAMNYLSSNENSTWTFTTAAEPSPGLWDTFMLWDTDLWN